MSNKRETRRGRRGGSPGGAVRRPWPRDVCLAAARAVVEEGLSAHAVAPRFGVPYTTLLEWSRKYRQGGEGRLLPAAGRRQQQPSRTMPAKTAAIVAAKRADPGAGSRRIRDVLKP